MKYSAVVLGVVLLAATVGAQSNASGPQLPRAPEHAIAFAMASDSTDPPVLLADAAPAKPNAAPLPASSEPAAAQFPQVYNVIHGDSFQLYAGYTFFRFYEIPSLTNTENGFDVGLTFFPHAGWIGIEGDMQGSIGHQAGTMSKFAFPAGGIKLRWAGNRGIQVFVHGLAGVAHFLPQTAFGGQNAFAYEAGGGIDITRGYHRLGYRAEVDAVGSRFFGTYQYSPKISAGIVFKF
ncbi:MAG: hypothetical protein KGL75_12600 [Acidobacteriota bacterium]|nr:hypothetical protein [Acidobacteriota bacterium]